MLFLELSLCGLCQAPRLQDCHFLLKQQAGSSTAFRSLITDIKLEGRGDESGVWHRSSACCSISLEVFSLLVPPWISLKSCIGDGFRCCFGTLLYTLIRR